MSLRINSLTLRVPSLFVRFMRTCLGTPEFGILIIREATSNTRITFSSRASTLTRLRHSQCWHGACAFTLHGPLHPYPHLYLSTKKNSYVSGDAPIISLAEMAYLLAVPSFQMPHCPPPTSRMENFGCRGVISEPPLQQALHIHMYRSRGRHCHRLTFALNRTVVLLHRIPSDGLQRSKLCDALIRGARLTLLIRDCH